MNILVICSDEQRRNGMAALGASWLHTPALDRLCQQGTCFSHAYTPSPICVPARASIATGLAVHEHQCWSSAEPYNGSLESWMHRLRAHGHHTASIGKLHFRSGEEDHGFMEELLPLYVANEGKGWPQGLIRTNPLPDFPYTHELALEAGIGESSYTDYDQRVTEETVRWLKRHGHQRDPWALFVSYVSPHYPLRAPAEFYDLYADVPIPDPIPAAYQDHPTLTEMRRFWNYDDVFDPDQRAIATRAYWGLCSFLDAQVGRILKALEDSNADQETLILFISDHGEMLGDHGFWCKSVMYEGSVGVPAIIKGPGVPQRVNASPVSLIDIAATVEDAAGLTPRFIQARSWLDLAQTSDLERPILSEYHDGGSPTGLFMLVLNGFKYVLYGDGSPSQLFDLTHDPHEQHNLADIPAYARQQAACHAALLSQLDPVAVNTQAFADQAAKIAEYGGVDAILAMQGFNHTPIKQT